MIFNFDAVRIGHPGRLWTGWTLPQLKAIYTQQDRGLDAHNWNTIFLSNHDNPRVVSTFGDDSDQYRVPSAKLLATMLLTLKGTPFIYQGDELAMTNYPFQSIDQFDDIEVKNGWKADVLTQKVSAKDYIANLRKTSRDHSRTPMQWDGSSNSGFTTGVKPWLAVNPNYKQVNAALATNDKNSVYSYFGKLIALRKQHPAFVYGAYQDLDPGNPKVFAYTRTLENDKYLVVLNFSSAPGSYQLPGNLRTGKTLLANSQKAEDNVTTLTLQPWEARIYKQ
jgi:oligo-1,6-glucosidase